MLTALSSIAPIARNISAILTVIYLAKKILQKRHSHVPTA